MPRVFEEPTQMEPETEDDPVQSKSKCNKVLLVMLSIVFPPTICIYYYINKKKQQVTIDLVHHDEITATKQPKVKPIVPQDNKLTNQAINRM